MGEAIGMRVALDLIHVRRAGAAVRASTSRPTSPRLLQIAAGDESAWRRPHANRSLRRDVRHAAAFFIEQVLLCPGADSYRVLGADAGTSDGELRRNMALLLKYMHPDLGREHSVFARRVTQAWNELKTPDRRAAYDRAQGDAVVSGARKKASKARARRASKSLKYPTHVASQGSQMRRRAQTDRGCGGCSRCCSGRSSREIW